MLCVLKSLSPCSESTTFTSWWDNYKIFDMRTFSEATCSESIAEKECSQLKIKFEDTVLQKSYAMLKLKPLRGESEKNTVSVEKSVQVKPNEEGIFSFYILPDTKDITKEPPVRVNIYVNEELKKELPFPIKPIFITLPLVKSSSLYSEQNTGENTKVIHIVYNDFMPNNSHRQFQ